MTKKQAIQLFQERKIRTAWDDQEEKWYFSIVDVCAVLTDSPNPRNYWKVLKHRLLKEGNQTVTNCNQLKLRAEDGRMRLTYSMDNQRDIIVHTAHGAVQQCIFISDVANFKTIYPPIEDIQRFSDFALEIRNKISKNEQESRRLAELRDTLLPKLMSGELKVN